jgi:pimeloyl-ACP methyl ester carboxylesterase
VIFSKVYVVNFVNGNQTVSINRELMNNKRTHYTTTTDGVTIGGTVHGHGSPLVLVHGIIGDGDLDFQALIPHLIDRFACHLPSMRGRGLSSDHPDLSFGRMVDDILTYIDSLGQPVGLIGWSSGADLALATAGQSETVNAVAVYEPTFPSLLDDQARAEYGKTFARMGELIAEGRLTEAMREFAGVPFIDKDLATTENTGYIEAAGRYVPNLLSTIQQQPEYRGPTPDDPAVLAAISPPVLVLHGSDSKPFLSRNVQHVADHVPNARLHLIPGAGHAGNLTQPEALADILAEFFATV